MPRLTNLADGDILERLKENCSKEKIRSQYSLQGELGAGAAGTVFRACQKSSGREVGNVVITVTYHYISHHLSSLSVCHQDY